MLDSPTFVPVVDLAFEDDGVTTLHGDPDCFRFEFRMALERGFDFVLGSRRSRAPLTRRTVAIAATFSA